jgi:hypothetical protein
VAFYTAFYEFEVVFFLEIVKKLKAESDFLESTKPTMMTSS